MEIKEDINYSCQITSGSLQGQGERKGVGSEIVHGKDDS